MKRKLLQIILFFVACAGISSCINLQHYTFRVCTYHGSFFAPELRGSKNNMDGYYDNRDELVEAYKNSHNGKEPVFNEDYYYHIRLFPQFTFYVPLGSDIRREVFTRRLNEIKDAAVPYYYTDNNNNMKEEYYDLPSLEDRSFWCYNENLANNFVIDQDLSFLLTCNSIESLQKKCAQRDKSWIQGNDHYVNLLPFNTITSKGFLTEDSLIERSNGFKVNTINMLLFVYNKSSQT